MKDLKRLKDGGVIETLEFKKLKSKALEDLERAPGGAGIVVDLIMVPEGMQFNQIFDV